MENRNHPRFPVAFTIAFSGDQATGKGEVINISTRGCAVESEVSVKTGAYLRLRIFLPGEEPPVGIDLGVVRWSIGYAFGMEFIRMDPQAQEIVGRLMQTLHADIRG